MKIRLEHLDARALHLDLGPPLGAVAIASAEALAGAVEQADDRLSLSGVTAARVVLGALSLPLGALVLSLAEGASLEGLAVAMERGPGVSRVDVRARALRAELRVEVGEVLVSGRFALEGARLVFDGDAGSLAAERVRIEAFQLRIGEVEASAAEIAGELVAIGWGAPSFQMTAKRLEAPGLQAHMTFGSSSGEPAGSAPRRATTPFVDLRVLDRLSGQIDVDLGLDLAVPILGRRTATHNLRVAVDEGTIDFIALEHNLSALEDALIDFAVRDGALVVERVNPLLPMRGHGKPVVRWALGEADLALAQQNRVRLAVLPAATLAADESPPSRRDGEQESAVALRELHAGNVSVRVAVAPEQKPLGGVLRVLQAGALALEGDVWYLPGAAEKPGSLRASGAELALALADLSLGSSRLDIARVAVGALDSLELALTDVAPSSLHAQLSALTIESFSLAPR